MRRRLFRTRPTLALLAATFLIIVASLGSVVGVGLAAQSPGAPASQELGQGSSLPPADEIYVEEDGNAVLVYETSDAEQSTRGHFGVDVVQGLLHVLIEQETDTSQGSANASLLLTPDEFRATANGSVQVPETLSSLDFDASLDRTNESASGEASLQASYQRPPGSVVNTVTSMSTGGSMTISASSFQSTGSANVEYQQPIAQEQSYEVTIQESSSGYSLDVSLRRSLSPFNAGNFDTREKARTALATQFAGIAQQLGGEASFELTSYDFIESEGERPILDVSFSVEYSGIDQVLSQQLATALEQARDLDVSAQQAEDLAQAVADIQVDNVHVSADVNANSASTSWDVEISQYGNLITAGFDLAASMTEEDSDILQQARTRYEARQAAGLTETFSWTATVSTSADSGSVDASVTYETSNWGAYVTELANRGVATPGSLSVDASAETSDGNIVANVSVTLQQQDLVQQAIDQVSQFAGQTAGTSQFGQYVTAFEQATFERSRVEISAHNGTMTFEAGASFANLSAFRSAIEADYPSVNVRSVYGSTDRGSDTTTTYVHLESAFEGSPDEATVRNHSLVGPETTIHLAGDWDPSEQSFTTPDADAANEFLGVEGESSSPGLPGFGFPAALAAIAALAALGLLRRRD